MIFFMHNGKTGMSPSFKTPNAPKKIRQAIWRSAYMRNCFIQKIFCLLMKAGSLSQVLYHIRVIAAHYYLLTKRLTVANHIQTVIKKV